MTSKNLYNISYPGDKYFNFGTQAAKMYIFRGQNLQILYERLCYHLAYLTNAQETDENFNE